MATGTIGSAGSSNYFTTATSIGCTMPAETYPNGTITFNDIKAGGAYWNNNSSSKAHSLTLYLCDSAGNNKVKIFDVSLSAGSSNTTIKSATISGATALAGKALYIIAEHDTTTAYVRLRNQTSITINTAVKSYTLTVAKGTGVSSVSGGGTKTYNTSNAISATMSTGYSFKNWTSNNGGSFSNANAASTSFTMPAGNVTVTANGQLNSYTLTTAKSPTGGGSVTAGGSMGYNTKKQLTATAGTGYTFSKWATTAGALSSTSTNPTTFTMGTAAATVTAYFTLNSYTLTTAVSPSGGGSVTAGGSMGYNTKKQLTATASTGYSFSSWSKTSGTLSSTTANPTTFTIAAGAATVTANFTLNSYTLTTAVSPSGGGTVTAGGSMGYNTKKQLVATASTGYKFSSWSKTAGTLSNTTATTTTFTIGTSAATVTANFTLNSYTLTTAVSPSGAGTVTAGGSMGYNTKKQLVATAGTGYTFSSWSKTAGTLSNTTATTTTFTISTSAATVTANFTLNSYTLTVSKGTGISSVSGGGTKGYATKNQITATASTGYTFNKWTSNNGGTFSNANAATTTFTMPAGNVTVTASATINSYTLTVAKGTGISDVSGGGTKEYASKNQITATVATGYTFNKWTSNNGGTFSNASAATTTFTMPAGNVTATASATINSYTLTTAVSPAGGGTVTAGGTMEYNSQKQLTATAATGYTFDSWSKTAGTLSSTSSNPTTFTIAAGNATVTANFTHNTYTLSCAVSPADGGTVTLGATSGFYNDEIDIIATPATGYAFDGWTTTAGTIASASSASTKITMAASNATVTATFVKIDYAVTCLVDPSGAGTITVSKNPANYGDTITITQTAASGYVFDSYTTSPVVTITNDTFTMPPSDITITANFVVSNKIYFKNNNTWTEASAVYKKSNGIWVLQDDLTTVFDPNTNYVRGN